MKEGQPISNQSTKTEFELALERTIGESLESVKKRPIDEQRRLVEEKNGSPMKVISYWPIIGRGEPLPTIDKQEVDKLVDKAIK